jgi:hypothetical protein
MVMHDAANCKQKGKRAWKCKYAVMNTCEVAHIMYATTGMESRPLSTKSPRNKKSPAVACKRPPVRRYYVSHPIYTCMFQQQHILCDCN